MTKTINFNEISVHSSAEESPGFLLWRASTLWRRAIEDILKPLGLTHPQFVVLATTGWLTRMDKRASQAEIGRQAALDPNTTSQILRSLQAKGLIERSYITDERSKYPTLTASGAESLAKALPAVEAADAAFFSSVDLKESAILQTLQILALSKMPVIKKRSGASVNAYLILKQDDKVLFHLRKNTGYCDGMWSLIAGHVEDGESATAAMIREVREEIGIELSPSQIKVVHVMHRQTNRLNVDVFFDCPSWQGAIKNCEPEKCERLEFFSMEALPENVVEYNVTALNNILNREFYSEQGWE